MPSTHCRFVLLIQNNFARLGEHIWKMPFYCRLIWALLSLLSPLRQDSSIRATSDTEGRKSKREQATLIAIAEGGSGCWTRIRRQQKMVGLLISFYENARARIFKHLRNSGFNVVWRTNTSNRVVVPVRRLESIPGLLKKFTMSGSVPAVFYQSGKGKPFYMKVIKAVREFALNYKHQEKIV
jgi:hypothetical protein